MVVMPRYFFIPHVILKRQCCQILLLSSSLLDPLRAFIMVAICVLDRKGLGKDTIDKRTSLNKEMNYKVDMSDFRQRKKDKLSVNRVWRDIRKCQHACEQLDKDKASDKTTFIHHWCMCMQVGL